MPDQDNIAAVERRLAAARQRLATLLQQLTLLGPNYVPPGTVADIADARNTIQYCKSVLRGYNVDVEDQRDDEATESPDASIGAFAKERADVLARLQSFWIEGVLNQSLHGVTLLELGLSYDPESVKHPWEMVVEVPGLQAAIIAGTPIVQIFDAQDGRLLILGAPGAGKTTMLLELARALISRARADRRFPLPVILHLAHWSALRSDKQPRPFTEWVAEEIALRYDIMPQAANEWLRQSALILLLDGLDEVTTGQRQPCIDAINAFRHTNPSVRLVVCSRIEEYEQTQKILNLNGAIRIAPLSQAQIDAYLRQLGEQTNIVRTLLAYEPALQELATTPLLLNIMILAYQGLADLPHLANDTSSWRIQIFTDYVQRMLRQKGVHRRYPADKTIAWLSWIAGQLWLRNRSSFAVKSINEAWQPSGDTHLGSDDEPGWGMGVGAVLGGAAGVAVGGGLASFLTIPMGAMSGAFIGYMAHEFVFRPIVRPRILKNLRQKELIPEDLNDFLDHCVRLIFLRKAGVEYIFIHRLLLERFVFWEAPHIAFEEERYLNELKQYLAQFQNGNEVAPARYSKYRWVLMQYSETASSARRTPTRFIHWVEQNRKERPAWFKKWFPAPTEQRKHKAPERAKK